MTRHRTLDLTEPLPLAARTARSDDALILELDGESDVAGTLILTNLGLLDAHDADALERTEAIHHVDRAPADAERTGADSGYEIRLLSRG